MLVRVFTIALVCFVAYLFYDISRGPDAYPTFLDKATDKGGEIAMRLLRSKQPEPTPEPESPPPTAEQIEHDCWVFAGKSNEELRYQFRFQRPSRWTGVETPTVDSGRRIYHLGKGIYCVQLSGAFSLSHAKELLAGAPHYRGHYVVKSTGRRLDDGRLTPIWERKVYAGSPNLALTSEIRGDLAFTPHHLAKHLLPE